MYIRRHFKLYSSTLCPRYFGCIGSTVIIQDPPGLVYCAKSKNIIPPCSRIQLKKLSSNPTSCLAYFLYSGRFSDPTPVMISTGKCTSHWRSTAWPSGKKSERDAILPTIGSYAAALTWPGFARCRHCGHFLGRRYGSAVTTGERVENMFSLDYEGLGLSTKWRIRKRGTFLLFPASP